MKKYYILKVIKFFTLLLIIQLSNGQNPIIQPESNIPLDPELDTAIKEYEILKKKFPNKKDLSFNLGNLKYFKQDFTSAAEEYRNTLFTEDNLLKSQAHYNLGNSLYNAGEIENSLEQFKNALKLNPNDDDARHNYEFVKSVLQQKQQQDQKNDKNQDSDSQDKELDQENQSENSQSEEAENKDKNSQGQESTDEKKEENEKEQSDNHEKNKEEDQKSGEKSNEDQNIEEDNKSQNMTPEQMLEREEAEAILNTLKASEQNLMKRIYKVGKRAKIDKDW